MSEAGLFERVQAVRQFSRFYTRRIGVLHEGLLGAPLSLTEGRVIYELAQTSPTTASRLAAELDLDAGYLSRILRGFERRGLIERRPSECDGRQQVLSLTPAGRDTFATINAQSQAEVGAMLEALSGPDQDRLVAALRTAEALLRRPDPRPAWTLRPPAPGDMGWIVHRQAVLYAQEYGWNQEFEALVAEIVAGFVRNFDPARERCWIAERGGTVLGSIFLVRDTDERAKLRLLYVEPDARGLGIGRRLVNECIEGARQMGYGRLALWTNDVLSAARRIYEQAGFRLVAREPHHSFGHDLIGEHWERAL